MRSFKYQPKQKFQDEEGKVLTILRRWWKREKSGDIPYYTLQVRMRGRNLKPLLVRKEETIEKQIEKGKWKILK